MYAQVGVMQGGKPHIRFETRTEEDRAASIEAERKIYKDVDWVIVTPHGSRDFMENHAEQWLKNIQSRAEVGQYDMEWVQQFRKMYEMYKEGKEMPLDGTPLRMMTTLFSPAEIANMANVHVLTLEAAASMNEETIGRLGMGAREWKHRAQEAARLQEGTGGALKIAALETENNDLKSRVSDLENVIRDLQTQMSDNGPRRGRPPKQE
tara:strand:- start:858 stop:1481 length:624 start_codon:yes stop_codon:yes gene_type:complete